MSDTQDLSTLSSKDFSGYYIARQRAKLIKDGIENNSAPFMPDSNGKVNPIFIYNAKTGFNLEANTLIPAVCKKVQQGFESNMIGTFGLVNEAKTEIKENEKGVGRIFKDKNNQFRSSYFYFPEQVKDPDAFKKVSVKEAKWEQRLPNETFKITSPEITEYLGTYVAACNTGAKIEVNPEIAEKFKANILAVTENELKKTAAEKNPDIPKMSELLSKVDSKALNLIVNRQRELGILPEKKVEQAEKQHKRSQKQSISR